MKEKSGGGNESVKTYSGMQNDKNRKKTEKKNIETLDNEKESYGY